MPEKQLLTVDLGFWKLIATSLGSVCIGGYAVFLMLRNSLKKDVVALNKKIEECEEDHVYKDVFKGVDKKVDAIYNHLLQNPAHNKRDNDEDNH